MYRHYSLHLLLLTIRLAPLIYYHLKRGFLCGKVDAVVGRGLFQKGTDLTKFVGLKLTTGVPGEVGVIESAFGSSGKFNVRFRGGTTVDKGAVLTLAYRRYVFEGAGADKRAMKQI